MSKRLLGLFVCLLALNLSAQAADFTYRPWLRGQAERYRKQANEESEKWIEDCRKALTKPISLEPRLAGKRMVLLIGCGARSKDYSIELISKSGDDNLDSKIVQLVSELATFDHPTSFEPNVKGLLITIDDRKLEIQLARSLILSRLVPWSGSHHFLLQRQMGQEP